MTGPSTDDATTVTATTKTAPAKHKTKFYIISVISIVTLVYTTFSLGPSMAPTSVSIEKVSNRTILLNARQQHLAYSASTIARVYPTVPASTWCIDGGLKHEQSKRRPMGLCYLKLPKAASSTLAGVNKRIVKQFAHREGLSHSCIRHDGHVPGMFYYKRHDLSFLWTSVRDPASRALSRVVFSLSENPSVLQNHSKVMQALKTTDVQYGAISSGRGGFQLQYAMLTIIDEWSAWSPSNPTQIINPAAIKRNVAQVINGYNFIAVVERMDESLVALQLLLGLEVTDILYLSAKENGSYDRRTVKDGSRQRKWKCVRLASFNRTQELDDYFESTEWFAKNYGDYLLYTAANLSLDRTILDLGLVRFSQALAEYRTYKKSATMKCSSHAIFPCSANGTDQYEASRKNCYAEDEGCGYPCLDENHAGWT